MDNLDIAWVERSERQEEGWVVIDGGANAEVGEWLVLEHPLIIGEVAVYDSGEVEFQDAPMHTIKQWIELYTTLEKVVMERWHGWSCS